MKKSIASLLLVLLMGVFVSAAYSESLMEVKCSTDYEKMELKIDITSQAPYIQNITILLYDANLSEFTINNFSKIYEVTVENGKTKQIVFPINNDFTSANNKYLLKVQGNGYLSSQCTYEGNVFVIPPNKINGASGILTKLNSSNINTLAIDINDFKDALNLANEANVNETRLYQSFLLTRDSDYNKFKNLNEVRCAWGSSLVASYISDATVDTNSLITLTENNADSFDVDFEDSDYISNKKTIYDTAINYEKGPLNGKVLSKKELNNLIKECIATTCINAATTENILECVTKYYDILKIDNDIDSKFKGFSSESKNIVVRQLVGKNFGSANSVKSVFQNAVTQVYNNIYTNQTSSDNKIISGGGGGGIGSGVSLPSGLNEDKVNNNSSNGNIIAFYDCGENHWAYSYVKALTQKGAISGYENGEFRPDKVVNREEFIKILISAAGIYSLDAKCDFQDVSGEAWYYIYVASAKERGIVSGISDETFGIGMPITREDVAVIVLRTLKQLSLSSSSAREQLGYDFEDYDSVSEYAKNSVVALSELQIINGFDDGTFKPKDYLTRAQAAVIIFKMCELLN